MNKLKDHISQKTQPSYEVSRKEKDSAIIFLLFTSEAKLKFGKYGSSAIKQQKKQPKMPEQRKSYKDSIASNRQYLAKQP